MRGPEEPWGGAQTPPPLRHLPLRDTRSLLRGPNRPRLLLQRRKPRPQQVWIFCISSRRRCTQSSGTRAGLNFPGALPSTEGSFPGGLGRAVLLAWCQVPLQLGSTSPPGTLLGGHLSKESPVWVGVRGWSRGRSSGSHLLLAWMTSPPIGAAPWPLLLHPCLLTGQSWKGTVPTRALILLPSLPKKKKNPALSQAALGAET